MANKLDPMDLKQILTLHLDGYSNRKIGSVLGISRNTVNTYMQLFAGSEYSFQQLLSLTQHLYRNYFLLIPPLIQHATMSSCSILRGSIRPGIILALHFYITINNMSRLLQSLIAIPN